MSLLAGTEVQSLGARQRHLRKIFIKLGIGSRRELSTVLDKLGPDRPAA
jgi:hypothetical protein